MSCSFTIKNLRNGIMNTMPSMPPKAPNKAICSSSGSNPQKNNAGMVKMIPDASEELAEPVVERQGRQQLELGREAARKGLSVREVERRVRQRRRRPARREYRN